MLSFPIPCISVMTSGHSGRLCSAALLFLRPLGTVLQPTPLLPARGHQIPKESPLLLTPFPFIPFSPFIHSFILHSSTSHLVHSCLLLCCQAAAPMAPCWWGHIQRGGRIKGTETHYSPVRERCPSAALLPPSPLPPPHPPPALNHGWGGGGGDADDGVRLRPMTGEFLRRFSASSASRTD